MPGSAALVADVFQVGTAGPRIFQGNYDPSVVGVTAANASQYMRSDGSHWIKVGAADTDWLRSSLFVRPTNGEVVTIPAGSPIVITGTVGKRAAASSLALAQVVGVSFSAATPTLPIITVTGAELDLPTATWDAITGQVGGLTPGATYWLGVVAGTLSTAPPVLAGQSVVVVGRALSTTSLFVSVTTPILL